MNERHARLSAPSGHLADSSALRAVCLVLSQYHRLTPAVNHMLSSGQITGVHALFYFFIGSCFVLLHNHRLTPAVNHMLSSGQINGVHALFSSCTSSL